MGEEGDLSYRLQCIIEGHQKRTEGRNMETGTEAESMKEPYLFWLPLKMNFNLCTKESISLWVVLLPILSQQKYYNSNWYQKWGLLYSQVGGAVYPVLNWKWWYGCWQSIFHTSLSPGFRKAPSEPSLSVQRVLISMKLLCPLKYTEWHLARCQSPAWGCTEHQLSRPWAPIYCRNVPLRRPREGFFWATALVLILWAR